MSSPRHVGSAGVLEVWHVGFMHYEVRLAGVTLARRRTHVGAARFAMRHAAQACALMVG